MKYLRNPRPSDRLAAIAANEWPFTKTEFTNEKKAVLRKYGPRTTAQIAQGLVNYWTNRLQENPYAEF